MYDDLTTYHVLFIFLFSKSGQSLTVMTDSPVARDQSQIN
jgi:hypothetical protein